MNKTGWPTTFDQSIGNLQPWTELTQISKEKVYDVREPRHWTWLCQAI
jgi:hypothetical protein